MLDSWIHVSRAVIDPARLVAIERGDFDQQANEFRAVLVFDGGARVSCHETIRAVIERIREGALAIVERQAIADAAERAKRGAEHRARPPSDLTRAMAYVDAVTLARQFLALYEMPDPATPAWTSLIATTGRELAAELRRLFDQFERYDDGTPIAGAGCT